MMDSNAYILDVILTTVLWLSMLKVFATVRKSVHNVVGDVNVLAFELKKKRPVIVTATLLLTALYWFLAWRQYALMQHFAADGISAMVITTVLMLAAPMLALSYAAIVSIPKFYMQSADANSQTMAKMPYTQHPQGMSDYGGMGGL